MRWEAGTVDSDDARDEVRAFMHRTIGPRSGLQIPTTSQEAVLGFSSLILTIRHGNELVAATFASIEFESVPQWIQAGRFDVAEVVATRLVIVHQIAVHDSVRRRGIGGRLLDEVLRLAQTAGFSVAALNFDSTTGGLRDFYERSGFTCMAPGEPLAIKFAEFHKVIGFPLDEPVDTWAHRVLAKEQARVGRLQDLGAELVPAARARRSNDRFQFGWIRRRKAKHLN